jgi:hypothetical protein
MKKLVLLMGLSFILLSGFGQTPILTSLNGYNESVADSMIASFNKVGTQPPQVTSVWFDKVMVQNMIALLNSENRTNRSPDGIRIYYAYEPHSKNETIVLVSTYDSGISNADSYEGDNYHYDNWMHSPSASLFNMQTSINGKPCHDDCKHGALLYAKMGQPENVDCDPNNPHYLTRSLCEDMVIGYAKQQIKINTRAEWFDLDMINGFMKVFQNNNVDGIRIYFALNPVNNSYTLYGGKDTFVIVPTTGLNTDPDFHKDYFDCSFASDFFKHSTHKLKNQLNVKLKSYFSETDKATRDVMFTSPYGGQDNGQLCPFNCN